MANNAYLPALLVLVGGLLYQAPASALNPTGKFTVKYTVVKETCSFDSSVKTAITLPNVDLSETQITGKYTNFPVSFTCNEYTPSVTIYATGIRSNTYDFKNTGTSTGYAMRLSVVDGPVLSPDGASSPGASLISVKPVNGRGQQILRASYVIADGESRRGGTFVSTFTLNFRYP